jgi:hypothetical protein
MFARNLHIVLIFILLFTSCNSQTKQQNKMNSNKELTLEELKKQGYQIKERDTILMKDGKLDIEYIIKEGSKYSDGTFWDYDKTLEDGTHIHLTGDKLSGYRKSIIKKAAYLETYYNYYPSGNLEKAGMLYDNYFDKGTWYWYNERGQINRLEEYDKPYKYTWEDVLTFIQQKEIKKENIYKILRWIDEKTKQPYWSLEITLKRDYNNNTILTQYYKLDGNTGTILEEKEQTYTYKEF